jgi:hypothetical protein
MADNPQDNIDPTPSPAPKVTPSIPEEWQHLSVEDVKLLEAARKERHEAEAKANQFKVEALKLEQENRSLLQGQAVREAFREAGVRFHPSQSDVIKLLGQEVEFDGENVTVDGKPLDEALRAFALANETLVDGRSIRALKDRQEAANPTPKSKADFKSVAERTAFIEREGLAKWESLPNRPLVTLRGVPSREQWKHMTVSQKTACVNQHGNSIVSRILKGEFDK